MRLITFRPCIRTFSPGLLAGLILSGLLGAAVLSETAQGARPTGDIPGTGGQSDSAGERVESMEPAV